MFILTMHVLCPGHKKKMNQFASDMQVKHRSSVGIFKHADSTPWSMSGNWYANCFLYQDNLYSTGSQDLLCKGAVRLLRVWFMLGL